MTLAAGPVAPGAELFVVRGHTPGGVGPEQPVVRGAVRARPEEPWPDRIHQDLGKRYGLRVVHPFVEMRATMGSAVGKLWG